MHWFESSYIHHYIVVYSSLLNSLNVLYNSSHSKRVWMIRLETEFAKQGFQHFLNCYFWQRLSLNHFGQENKYFFYLLLSKLLGCSCIVGTQKVSISNIKINRVCLFVTPVSLPGFFMGFPLDTTICFVSFQFWRVSGTNDQALCWPVTRLLLSLVTNAETEPDVTERGPAQVRGESEC